MENFSFCAVLEVYVVGRHKALGLHLATLLKNVTYPSQVYYKEIS